MSKTYRSILELPKESFFSQLEDNLIDLGIDLHDYMQSNRSKFSRNQYTDAKRILKILCNAQGKCQAIILSIRPPIKPPVDGLVDSDIPF